MSLKFTTVPTKRLAASILSTDASITLSDVLGWDGAALEAGDFGSQAFGVLRNPTNTLVEIFEFDPSTIATGTVTLTRRGLAFDATVITTEVAANKRDWVKGETLVEIGTDAPHVLQWLKNYIDAVAIAGAPNASTVLQGLLELGTAAEVNAGTATGGSGAPLAVTPDALQASNIGLYAPSSSQKAFLNATTGMISLYAGSATPTGFLDCDGSAVSRATYATLFGVIGTAFGAGDGSTTFNVPNFKGATPIGTGQRVKTFSFVDANVNTGTDVITVSSNQYLYHGTPVVLSNSGGTLPGGLSATTYYVIRVSATTIKLASSVQNANEGTAVNITSAAGGGTHTLTLTMTTRAVGDEGGKETDTTVGAHTHTHNAATTSGSSGGTSSSNYNASATINAAGESDPSLTTNMPPFVSVRFIIKT